MFRKKALVKDLTDYIIRNLKKRYTKEALKWALINQGYSRIEIEKALILADKEMAEMAPILKTKPEIKYEIVEAVEKKKWKFFGKFFSGIRR